MRPANLIILIVLNFFWAAALSVYKIIGQYLEPGGIVTLRFGLAAVSLLVLWPWLPGAAPGGRDLAKTGALGLIVFVVGHRLQVLGNKLGTASNSSVLVAVEPLMAAVAAAIFLRERIGPRRLVGFAFGLLGLALLNGVWRSDFQWLGLGASLIFISSFVCEAAYSIVGKLIISRSEPTHPQPLAEREQNDARPDAVPLLPASTLAARSRERRGSFRRCPPCSPTVAAGRAVDGGEGAGGDSGFISPVKVLAISLTVGTAANLLIDGPSTLVAASRLPAQAWLLLLGLALICTAFGYSFWFLVIRDGEVNVAALTIFSQPVFGVALAKVWLGETLHWGQLWGSAAIVLGLVIGLSRQMKAIHETAETR
jgi:drug/metabolite transporter (DMT)-like permease